MAPSSYGSLDVRPRSEVTISAGTYYFDSFNFEPETKLTVEASGSESVIVYVKNSFVFKGSFTNEVSANKLLFVYIGQCEADLHGAFKGTLVAPNAWINLRRPKSGNHNGSWFAKGIKISPDQQVGYTPYNITQFVAEAVREEKNGVVLHSTRYYNPERAEDGATGDEVILFQLPPSLPVVLGNAGNQTAVLSWKTPSEVAIECDYRGGSTEAHPITPIEIARGKVYKFVGCFSVSNGQRTPYTLYRGSRSQAKGFGFISKATAKTVWA